MAHPRETEFDIGHPAPDRDRVNGWMLAFGLFGGALAWSGQLTAIAGLAGVSCPAGDGPQAQIVGGNWPYITLAAVNLVALLVTLAALLASCRTFSRTGKLEKDLGESGGLLDAGEGRSRFLAIWGIFADALFFLAIGFNTVSVFWVGLCES